MTPRGGFSVFDGYAFWHLSICRVINEECLQLERGNEEMGVAVGRRCSHTAFLGSNFRPRSKIIFAFIHNRRKKKKKIKENASKVCLLRELKIDFRERRKSLSLSLN